MQPYTDSEWSEIESELPQMTDQFVQQYLTGRASLIAEEAKQRSDASFRAAMSPIARKAHAIIERIRRLELATIWTPQAEDLIAQQEQVPFYPGMMFTHAKERMEKTKLWEIVRKMPKGALLHAHMEATVEFEYIFDEILKMEGMHFAAEGPLDTEEKRKTAEVMFRYKKTEQTGTSIWSDEYQPMTFLPAAKVAAEFPQGGREGFVRWLKRRCTLASQDSEEQFRGVDHIWTKFTNCFAVTRQALHYEPVTRLLFRKLMEELHGDGVMWAELRFVWPTEYYRDKSETPEPNNNRMLEVIDEEIRAFKSTHPDFWGIRFICTTIRGFSARMIANAMEQSIIQKLQFPHLIAGFDLVGPEDRGRPLTDMLPELFWFRKQCAQEGVEMPFFFHAGETLGDGNDTDKNLFDAVLLGTRRIGHGFSLFKHPLLIDMVREKKILIESCPISNEILRLTGSIMSHPLPALLARGVPCSLCNDDPAMLGQEHSGMSHDFWQALQGWENLGLAGLGSLAENSVRWAVFEDQNADVWGKDIREGSLGKTVKSERLKEWEVKWEEFCLWVVTEFGEGEEL